MKSSCNEFLHRRLKLRSSFITVGIVCTECINAFMSVQHVWRLVVLRFSTLKSENSKQKVVLNTYLYVYALTFILHISNFLTGDICKPKGAQGLVSGKRQWWLTNRQGWTKAWRGSIWHWLPSEKPSLFISCAIVKLMSYESAIG